MPSQVHGEAAKISYLCWRYSSVGVTRLAQLTYLSYDGLMKTLTIRLPDALAERLEQEALERQVSKSVIVRERLNHPAPSHLADASLRNILEAAWSEKVPGRPRRYRSSGKQKLADLIRAKKLHR